MICSDDRDVSHCQLAVVDRDVAVEVREVVVRFILVLGNVMMDEVVTDGRISVVRVSVDTMDDERGVLDVG